MKFTGLLLLFSVLFSCSQEHDSLQVPNNEKKQDSLVNHEILMEEFQPLFDSLNVKGSVLIYNPENETYYSNDFEWSRTGKLPASTFKIANSLVALELGIVENEKSIFEWNGEKRGREVLEKDMSLSEAFALSCVECYQEVAREVGVENMIAELEKINYPKMGVDSTNLDNFWLVGESKISAFEQIEFLVGLNSNSLPISQNTTNTIKTIMFKEALDGFKLYGKTGWSFQDNLDNGWFVGYTESENKMLYFATNIEAENVQDFQHFGNARIDITLSALENLDGLDSTVIN